MFSKKLILLFLFLFSLSASVLAKTYPDSIKEIPVILNVGTDTKVSFPDGESLVLGIRKSSQAFLSHELVDNIIYLKAKQDFSEKRHRLLLKSKKTSKTYILIASFGSEADQEIKVVKTTRKSSSAIKNKRLEAYELVRHASQALYSPDYAIEKPNILKHVTVDKSLDLDHIYRGSSIAIRPQATFKYNEFFVYAFNVKNKRNSIQKLRKENLFGRVDAIGAAFQHAYVGVGDDKYSTLYIVSYHANLLSMLVG
ncbi:DUF3438 family protein [Pseudoalteromonas luteoviolacea]|uniref:Uncharacterized protein n=1 Tax=Pseudoalteromonas luteoviolacea S4060-1 TaxID=1365257 RepID=A0A162AXP3_9GAMM|nr:DUF3438 family protein [Pseudoalteromonas luteoviolacea]KZN63382.1 hypothetical protein N478_03775 [Pseudoalteromonas luteoviolacea S4060-1]